MKNRLRQILIQSAQPWAPLPPFDIERPKVKAHGELSTNLAMVVAKGAGENPQEIAKEIISLIVDPEKIVETVSVAGGGFLNFVFKKEVWQESLKEIVKAGPDFGKSTEGKGRRVVVEFVSANPTGPLHIGNARGGPLGDALASLLEAVGYEVVREYYVNDVGGQIEKLGQSISYWLEHEEGDVPPPEGLGYQGDYVKELAKKVLENFPKKIPEEEVLGKFGIDELLREIQRDCADAGIRFDSWVHEKEILAARTAKILEELKKNQATAEKEGAVWFVPPEASGIPLEDRESVLVRSDGRPTYFANDIAYHTEKYRRRFDRIINIWGSNHHGHVPRIKAAVKALGYEPEKIETVLYQFVRVKRGNEAVKMSKRGGNFVTAREVLDEVGRDAFRFFLLMRAPGSHLDFDLELAKKESRENPVYYVQYAHARLASIERKAVEMKIPSPATESVKLELLDLPEEIEMIRMIHEFPEEVSRSAKSLEPHRITFYLLELSKVFQAYYTKARQDSRYRVLSGDVDTSQAKRYLCAALKLTLSQGLKLLGISAPEVMVQEKQ